MRSFKNTSFFLKVFFIKEVGNKVSPTTLPAVRPYGALHLLSTKKCKQSISGATIHRQVSRELLLRRHAFEAYIFFLNTCLGSDHIRNDSGLFFNIAFQYVKTYFYSIFRDS